MAAGNDKLNPDKPSVAKHPFKDVEIIIDAAGARSSLASSLEGSSSSFVTYFHWLKICIQTKVLKTTVFNHPSVYPVIEVPAKFKTNVTTS